MITTNPYDAMLKKGEFDAESDQYLKDIQRKKTLREQANRVMTQPDVNAPKFSQETDTRRQVDAIDDANKRASDDPEDRAANEPSQAHAMPVVNNTQTSGPTPYNIHKQSKADLQKFTDAHMDKYDMLEQDLRSQRAELETRGMKSDADYRNANDIDQTLEHISRSRDLILQNNSSWYKRGGAGQEAPTVPANTEPGILDNILKGTADTAKFAVQHPQRFAAHAGKGLKDFAELPLRALETGIMGEGKQFPIRALSPKAHMEDAQAEIQKGDTEAGVQPGTGPNVAESVGGMLMPVGPTLKAGHHIGNILKGAAFGGGVSALDQLSQTGDIKAEETAPAAGIGGTITGLLSGLLGRGKLHAPATREPLPPSKGLPAPGEGVIYQPGPLKQLLGPEARGPVTGEPPPGGPHVPPPNAAGRFDSIGTPLEARTAMASKDVATPPSSPPYPGSIYGMPGVKSPRQLEAEATAAAAPAKSVKGAKPQVPIKEPVKGIIEDLLARKAAPPARPVASTSETISPNVLEVAKKPGGIAEAFKKSEATMPKEAKAPAAVEQSIAEAEAELSGIVKGTKDVASVPVRREPPKSVAPTSPKGTEPQAVGAKLNRFGGPEAPADFQDAQQLKDFYGAINRHGMTAEQAEHLVRTGKQPPQVGDVTEISIPDSLKNPEVLAGEIAAKVKVPFVEKRIEAAKARLAARSSGNVAKAAPATPNRAKVMYDELVAGGMEPGKARDKAEWKTNERLPKETPVVDKSARVEQFIEDSGYKVRTREPFPGQKEYDVTDPKTGNVIARGDRSALVTGLGERAEAKGIKLSSFPGDLGGFKEHFENMLSRSGTKPPKGVEIENAPAKRGLINATLQAVETPDFLMRKYAPGKEIVNTTNWSERMVGKRVNDLMYTHEGQAGSQPTKLFGYFEMPKADRAVVDRVLVLGDKRGKEFTHAQLRASGLTDAQIGGYEGVREALTKVREWVHDSGELLDARKLIGYIPRVWHGNIELFNNGVKHVGESGTSSFETLREASAEAFKLKQANPGAKISMKFFADPEYLGGRAFQDAQVISRLKRNLEKMGSATPEDVDRAYSMGRDLKGFAKHLEMRKGEAGYESQDLDKVLFNYFNKAAKMVEMRNVKETVKKVLSENVRDLTPGQVSYLQHYVERVAGKPTWDQMFLHSVIKDTPLGNWIDPVHGSRALQTVKQAVNHLTLGMGNMGWAMMNVDSLIRHTWPALQREGNEFGALASEKFLLPAVKQFFTDKAMKQKLAHWGVVDIQAMSEVRPQVGHIFGKGEWTPQRVSMALGTATEEFTRGVSAIARYNMARAQGLDDIGAMKLAAQFVDATQGRYTRAGKPAAFTGVIGETVGMYKTFMSVFMQNAYQAFADVGKGNVGPAVRYMIATTGISGLMGLPFVDDLDQTITKHTGWSPVESFNKHTPVGIMTGLASIVPGALGHPEYNMDWSKKAGMPDVVPQDMRSAMGPVVGRAIPIMSDILNVISSGAQGDFKGAWYNDMKQLGLDFLPNSIKPAVNVLRGSDQGVVMGRNDRPTTRLSPGEQVVKGVGFPPAREVSEQRQYMRSEAKLEHRNDRLAVLKHKIVQGTANAKDEAEFADLGGTNRMLRNEGRAESETRRERQMRHLPRMLRMEEESF